MAPIRILIVDDHTMVRDGLNTMLSAERFRRRRRGEQRARSDHLSQDRPRRHLRTVSGVEAMRTIGSRDPDVRFIGDTDEYIFDAIEAGATGYLLKDTSREELFNAVRAVHRGESQIEPGVAAKVLSRFQELSRHGPEHNRESLSEREIEVLQLIARGSANKQIAGELLISESTVKTHVANIFRKLNVSHRTEAVTQALQRGIIKL